MRGKEYIDELSGVVALPDHMPGSLMEFARRIKVYIDLELQKLSPDTGLVAVLADAARLGWEQIEWAHAPLDNAERAVKSPNSRVTQGASTPTLPGATS